MRRSQNVVFDASIVKIYIYIILGVNHMHMIVVSQEQDNMFTILAAVLTLGNVSVTNSDDGWAQVTSGPGSPLRAVAVR